MSALDNDTNERETVRPIPGDIQACSLASYLEEHLCETQRATRALLETPACPPSGAGSDRATIVPPSL